MPNSSFIIHHSSTYTLTAGCCVSLVFHSCFTISPSLLSFLSRSLSAISAQESTYHHDHHGRRYTHHQAQKRQIKAVRFYRGLTRQLTNILHRRRLNHCQVSRLQSSYRRQHPHRRNQHTMQTLQEPLQQASRPKPQQTMSPRKARTPAQKARRERTSRSCSSRRHNSSHSSQQHRQNGRRRSTDDTQHNKRFNKRNYRNTYADNIQIQESSHSIHHRKETNQETQS